MNSKDSGIDCFYFRYLNYTVYLVIDPSTISKPPKVPSIMAVLKYVYCAIPLLNNIIV